MVLDVQYAKSWLDGESCINIHIMLHYPVVL